MISRLFIALVGAGGRTSGGSGRGPGRGFLRLHTDYGSRVTVSFALFSVPSYVVIINFVSASLVSRIAGRCAESYPAAIPPL